MPHYIVLKNRSGLSWTRSLASFQVGFGAEASCKRCCNPLRMCSHFVGTGRWRSNPATMSPVRGILFFRIQMLYPRPSTDIRSGGTKGMIEGKLPAHWRARNDGLCFAPWLFSGSVGRGRHSENSLKKRKKIFLDDSMGRREWRAGFLST